MGDRLENPVVGYAAPLFDIEGGEEPEGWVYVIGQPESSVVKIGTAIDVAKRLSEIQVSSPQRLYPRWKTPGGRVLEGRLHAEFRELRLSGEWFDFREKDPVVEVARAVAELQGRAPVAIETNEDWRPDQMRWRKRTERKPVPMAEYMRIAAEIRAELLSGTPAPGQMLDSVNVLMERFGAGNMTIQSALNALKAEGLVVASQGRGGFAFFDPRGPHRPTTDQPIREQVPLANDSLVPPADVRARLGIDRKAEVPSIHSMAIGEYGPVELSWHYVSPAYSDDCCTAGFDQDMLTARLPTAYEAAKLVLPPTAPIIRRFRTLRGMDSLVAEVIVTVRIGHLSGIVYGGHT